MLTETYFRLIITISSSSTTSTFAAYNVSDNWIIPNGIATIILIETHPKLLKSNFAISSSKLGSRSLTIIAKHLQTNWQTKQDNNFLFTRGELFQAEYQINWNLSIQLLLYAYNTQAGNLRNTASFCLMPAGRQSRAETFEDTFVYLPDGYEKMFPQNFSQYLQQRVTPPQLSRFENELIAAQIQTQLQ